MSERLFLYIDILGFSDLVGKADVVEALYNKIDRLNVFGHKGYYECIVFSDTVLVYSTVDVGQEELSSSIMWMCEFAQDLFYRLVGLDLHFRALLTQGTFTHSKLSNIQSFYGEALVSAYNYERRISCTGLFMDKRLVPHSDIFKTDPYDDNYFFVHIMQNLRRYFPQNVQYPIDPYCVEAEGMQYLLAYDIVYLKNVYAHMTNVSVASAPPI